MTNKVNNSTSANPQSLMESVSQAKGPHRARATERVEAPNGGAAGASADKDWSVNLSPRAREMAEARAKAMDIARKTPDVREDRVAELKARIADGSYKADAGDIADGMLREAIRDKVSTSEA